MDEVRRGFLLGYGRVQWSDALNLLDGFRAVWTDLDGWHVDRPVLPHVCPIATHLWAWDPDSDRWARARLDGGTAIIGVLGAVRDETPSLEAASVEPVEFTLRTGIPWRNDRQIPPRGDAIRELRFEVATLRGISPLTFVRLLDPRRN